MMAQCKIIVGDAIEQLPLLEAESIQTCITSPPYFGLRDYGDERQIGREQTPEEYINRLVVLFQQVRRVLKKNGTLWLNIGDAYSSGGRKSYDKALVSKSGVKNNAAGGLRFTPSWAKQKDRLMIPARVAIALQADGWYLRDEIVWFKPNPMPESVTDRTTKAHEFIYLLTKSKKYYYDYEAILEEAAYDGRIDTVMKGSKKYEQSVIPGMTEHTMASRGHERWPNKLPDNKLAYRQKHEEYGLNGQAFGSIHAMDGGIPARNKRSVWTVNTINCSDEHKAPFPPDLVKPCILAGSKVGDTVLDCCAGRGTTGEVALGLSRNVILIELNPKYAELCESTTHVTPGLPLT